MIIEKFFVTGGCKKAGPKKLSEIFHSQIQFALNVPNSQLGAVASKIHFCCWSFVCNCYKLLYYGMCELYITNITMLPDITSPGTNSFKIFLKNGPNQ